MVKLENKLFPTTTFNDGILRLVFGRLVFIFLLLLINWWWINSYLQLPLDEFPNNLFLLFVCSIGLSAIYYLAQRFNDNHTLQIRLQFFIDIFLITLLVRDTGTLNSPFITLYVILISVAGFYLGKNGTLLIAGLSSACFTLLSVLTTQSLFYTIDGDAHPDRYLQLIGFNNVAILIVGLLASRFSEKRKVSEELMETAANFADLHVLHKRIVELIPSGLIITDLEGVIHSFNGAAEEISGFEIEDTIGQNIYQFFGEEIRMTIVKCLEDVKNNDFPNEQFEAVIAGAFGEKQSESVITVACSVAPLIAISGEVYGLIITFQDITKIREMEETIRKTDRLTAVGRMAAGLAHEIRNPLGSMSSALQFLNEKAPPATTESSLMKVVLSESERLNKIITNFLTYANPSADIFAKDELELTDICETINDCLTLLRHSPEINDTHILEFELPKTPVKIRANETQIKQIFWNLSRNSIQSMPQGGKLCVRLKEFGNENVQLIFEDTGQGITADHLEHLFEPFSSSTNGTGLGLSIVHKIVCDHGGHIDVTSSTGEGTKVTVELPV